jgi:hypothetical protein
MPRLRSDHCAFLCFDVTATDRFYRDAMGFPLVLAFRRSQRAHARDRRARRRTGRALRVTRRATSAVTLDRGIPIRASMNDSRRAIGGTPRSLHCRAGLPAIQRVLA